MILGLALVFVFLLLLQDLLLYFFVKFRFKDHQDSEELGEWPTVSILIPSRNEADNLPDCLAALASIDYPQDKLEFILGNDGSTDATASILEAWGRDKTNLKIIPIQEGNPGLINGKANALSQMAKLANGEMFLFTDADCRVNVNWVKSMVQASQKTDAGILTGITRVKGKGWFSEMQALDWWLSLGMVKVLNDHGIAVTSMGNNMLIRKDAYEAVGGFEGIPFSLTEDFEIGKSIVSKGFKAIHHVNSDNLLDTQHMPSFRKLLEQRKRWMSGAMSLDLPWKVVLGVQVLFFPAILFLLLTNPALALVLWSLKILLQGNFIKAFGSKAGTQIIWPNLIVFEIYYLLTSWSTIIYYFWPTQTDWKGRKY